MSVVVNMSTHKQASRTQPRKNESMSIKSLYKYIFKSDNPTIAIVDRCVKGSTRVNVDENFYILSIYKSDNPTIAFVDCCINKQASTTQLSIIEVDQCIIQIVDIQQ